MTDDFRQEAYTDQIAAFTEAFMQLFMQIRATLPKELAQVRDRLDEIHLIGEPHPVANYDLFYRVSLNLYRKSNLTMGELSSALSVPLSTATRMVDWLVDNRYAQRLSDAEDRRIVRVALTDAGRKLHKAIDSYLRQRFQQVMSHLTDEEWTMLFTLIRKLVTAMRDVTA